MDFEGLFAGGARRRGRLDRENLVERLEKAEQDKVHMERQLEAASANWRSERERLIVEIEQSRRSLERVRAQAGSAEVSHSQHREADRLSRELEMRCQAQSAELETMRTRFEARIRELEQQLVEMMDRSGNTHRRTQAVDERVQVEVSSARRAVEVEWQRRMQSVQEIWFRERDILEREIERLKKLHPSEPRPSSERGRWIDRLRG